MTQYESTPEERKLRDILKKYHRRATAVPKTQHRSVENPIIDEIFELFKIERPQIEVDEDDIPF